MSLVDKMKQFLSGATPAAQLTEIETAIAAGQAERDQVAGGRSGAALAAMQGDPDARARRDAIDEQVAALDARLRDLRDAAGAVRRRINSEAEAERRREAEERPRRIAELVRERRALVQDATAKSEAAAAALLATTKNAAELAAILNSEPARRFLDFHAFRHRAQSALARAFQIVQIDDEGVGQPLTRENSLLGIVSHEIGPRSWMTLAHFEEEGLDDLAPFFDNEAEAAEAKERLAARATAVLIVPIAGGCFYLAPADQAFGDRAAADEAAWRETERGKPMVVLPHDGGFVLVPERFAGGASVSGRPAIAPSPKAA